MAQEPQTSQASAGAFPILSQEFRQCQEAQYACLSSKPLQFSRICNLVSLIPEDFSLNVMHKVTHHVKPSSESTYNRHFDCFRTYIESKVDPSDCFPLSLVVEFFNFLASKNFKSTTLKSIRLVLREPLKAYFPNYNIVADPWISKGET